MCRLASIKKLLKFTVNRKIWTKSWKFAKILTNRKTPLKLNYVPPTLKRQVITPSQSRLICALEILKPLWNSTLSVKSGTKLKCWPNRTQPWSLWSTCPTQTGFRQMTVLMKHRRLTRRQNDQICHWKSSNSSPRMPSLRSDSKMLRSTTGCSQQNLSSLFQKIRRNLKSRVRITSKTLKST